MKKFKIKRNDEVVVISGDHKGKRGKVLQLSPTNERVLIEGVNMIKKHQKKTQDNPNGAIVEREAPIHYSNVVKAETFDKKNKTKN